MGKAPFEIFTQSWDVLEIARLSGVIGEPGEDPEDLGGALGGENRIGLGEGVRVEARVGRAPACDIVPAKLRLEFRRHRGPRILAERGDVIGGRADHQVLEVDDAEPGDALALGEPERLGEWKSRSTQPGSARASRAMMSRQMAMNVVPHRR